MIPGLVVAISMEFAPVLLPAPSTEESGPTPEAMLVEMFNDPVATFS
jgi:hypothetical protein